MSISIQDEGPCIRLRDPIEDKWGWRVQIVSDKDSDLLCEVHSSRNWGSAENALERADEILLILQSHRKLVSACRNVLHAVRESGGRHSLPLSVYKLLQSACDTTGTLAEAHEDIE